MFFGSLHTSLLCIVGELAGRGSVVVAVGDRRQVTCDIWHMKQSKWHFFFCFFSTFLVSVLLSAHTQRDSLVSRMRDFFFSIIFFLCVCSCSGECSPTGHSRGSMEDVSSHKPPRNYQNKALLFNRPSVPGAVPQTVCWLTNWFTHGLP